MTVAPSSRWSSSVVSRPLSSSAGSSRWASASGSGPLGAGTGSSPLRVGAMLDRAARSTRVAPATPAWWTPRAGPPRRPTRAVRWAVARTAATADRVTRGARLRPRLGRRVHRGLDLPVGTDHVDRRLAQDLLAATTDERVARTGRLEAHGQAVRVDPDHLRVLAEQDPGEPTHLLDGLEQVGPDPAYVGQGEAARKRQASLESWVPRGRARRRESRSAAGAGGAAGASGVTGVGAGLRRFETVEALAPRPRGACRGRRRRCDGGRGSRR